MEKLTSRERIMRIFSNREVDRPSLKLWGASIDGPLLCPAYRPVCELAEQLSDIYAVASSPFDPYFGRYRSERVEVVTRETGSPLWRENLITYHTPKGDLRSVERVSTVGEPGYIMEYFVKEPEDIERLLSAPYDPYPFSADEYLAEDQKTGDRGVTLFGVDHPGYALQRLMGSATLASFSVECRELLIEALTVFSNRILEHTRAALEAGIRLFSWVGPEVFIPPLMSPQDFEDFVFRFDKPLCDLIHDAGGYVWVHCHGKVANFVGRYIDMGVDVLNPLEPPKNGDVFLPDIIGRYGRRIGWEGNIEIQEIIQAPPEQLRESIRRCVEYGGASGRFVLCPSAGFMEYPFPEQQYIDNLHLYLRYGYECVEACRS